MKTKLRLSRIQVWSQVGYKDWGTHLSEQIEWPAWRAVGWKVRILAEGRVKHQVGDRIEEEAT